MADLGNITPFMDAASKVKGIKKVQVVLPIARKSGNVTTLLVGDDLALRSSLTSPVGYDREMIQLLHKHTEFIEDSGNIQFPYAKFCQEISNIDKLSLIWGIYKSTYDTLGGERSFTCPKEECKHEFKDIIHLDDLIHEDTYVPWDKTMMIKSGEGEDATEQECEVPFHQYSHTVVIEYDNFVYEFAARLPSIQNNNIVLGRISIDVLQQNLEKIGSIFTRPQQMALLTKAVRLSAKDNSFAPAETSNVDEILASFQTSIPFVVAEEFFVKYGEEFDKYVPKYYKKMACPICGNTFDHNVDLEIEFFRRSLGLI